jgi:hypothetical protein
MIRMLHELAQGMRSTTLWRLIVPPTTWAAHFMFCYTVAAVHCAKSGLAAPLADVRVTVVVATLLALAVVVVSGFIGFAQSRSAGDPPPHQESTDEDRHRFLALSKLLLAGLSFVAIVFTALPVFVLEDCR